MSPHRPTSRERRVLRCAAGAGRPGLAQVALLATLVLNTPACADPDEVIGVTDGNGSLNNNGEDGRASEPSTTSPSSTQPDPCQFDANSVLAIGECAFPYSWLRDPPDIDRSDPVQILQIILEGSELAMPAQGISPEEHCGRWSGAYVDDLEAPTTVYLCPTECSLFRGLIAFLVARACGDDASGLPTPPWRDVISDWPAWRPMPSPDAGVEEDAG